MTDFARAHRTAWLVDQLHKHGSVAFPKYHRKFGCTDRTYYRDLAILNEVEIKVRSRRDHGTVELASS